MIPNNKISLALADEENIFKKGLKMILKKFPKVSVVGEASDSAQLRQLVLDKQPDIILTDVHMNGSDIVAAIRKIVKQNPSTQVIVLSNHQEDSLIVNVLEAGACGYLLKDVSADELYIAIQEVQKGNRYYSKKISDKIMKLVAGKKYNRAVKQKPAFTETEKEIIAGICQEKTSKEIADLLCLSIRTVEGYRISITRKMRVRGSVGIAVFAIKHGLYKLEWQLN